MTVRQAFVHRIAMRAPDDVASLHAAIAAGSIEPHGILAILGKTEGNGCVNDFTRGFASRSIQAALCRHLPDEAAAEVCLVMSGGTEGALSPHMTVLEARAAAATGEPGALALGRARTAAIPPEAVGRLAQVDLVAEGVRAAMRNAGIEDPADVHFVQIKCPLLTSEGMAQAVARGRQTATRDTLKSMGLSRAAAALGTAVALGEVERSRLTEAAIGRDWSFYSARASTSAGAELNDHQIVVMGTGAGWCGPLRVDHAVMADAVDVEPVRAGLARLGLGSAGQLSGEQRARLHGLFAKADPGSTGRLRGYRHTMLDDSDISATRHARGFVAGALAALVGHAEIYVSGGAEHQGPDGGGPVALIVATV